ncbi:hypothetical protein [Shewanella marisflavi]|uniref:hypothetical protein n=1 Tax=Shewanella marisflavi TaxID=260364 RepID=UPI003AAAA795
MITTTSRLKLDKLEENYGKANNVFFAAQAAARKIGLNKVVTPTTVAAVGLIAFEVGLVSTLHEWNASPNSPSPFDINFLSDYLGELVKGEREFIGEYISAIGAGTLASSPVIAAVINRISEQMSSLPADPFHKLYNKLANWVSPAFRETQLETVSKALAEFSDAYADTNDPAPLESAWKSVSERIAPAVEVDMQQNAGKILRRTAEFTGMAPS